MGLPANSADRSDSLGVAELSYIQITTIRLADC